MLSCLALKGCVLLMLLTVGVDDSWLTVPIPSSPREWQGIAQHFFDISKFPHCLGAIDGKHIYIKKPANSGSFYFNYKKRFSVVLMAVVNANSEFIMVDVGTNGRISDGGVLGNTKFFKKLENKSLTCPAPTAINEAGKMLPYVFIGDDAFALREDLLKPFAHANLSKEECLFNQRLSSARVKVENAFGILSSRFRILLTNMQLAPEKAALVTLTCCYLHNFLRREKCSAYSRLTEMQTTNHEELTPLERSSSKNSSVQAKNVRKDFCDYLASL